MAAISLTPRISVPTNGTSAAERCPLRDQHPWNKGVVIDYLSSTRVSRHNLWGSEAVSVGMLGPPQLES